MGPTEATVGAQRTGDDATGEALGVAVPATGDASLAVDGSGAVRRGAVAARGHRPASADERAAPGRRARLTARHLHSAQLASGEHVAAARRRGRSQSQTLLYRVFT